MPTIFAARQFVNHGHVNVNGRRVNIPSYRCKTGDVIEVREKSKQLVIVLELVQLAERDVPDYIDVDHNKMVATFARVPGLGDVPFAVRWNRTWSSNSTRAEPFERFRRSRLRAAFLLGRFSPVATVASSGGQHSCFNPTASLL